MIKTKEGVDSKKKATMYIDSVYGILPLRFHSKKAYERKLASLELVIDKKQMRVDEIEHIATDTPQRKRAWTLANNVLKQAVKRKERWLEGNRIED